MLISSKQNPKIKHLAKLNLKKHRDSAQQFLIEGYYPLSFAINNNWPLEELYVCRELLRDKFDNQQLINMIQSRGVPITNVSADVFEKIASYESREGLVALAPQKHTHLDDYHPPISANDIYLVAEAIEKLSNLGAIFRLADNVGARGVVVTNMRADIFNPEVIRSSIGTFFSITILQATTPQAIQWFKQHAITTIATSPHAQTSYLDVGMSGSVAIVLGAEYTGLSEEWLTGADVSVQIPMRGQANSLSVTASAAILAYEALRQKIKEQG